MYSPTLNAHAQKKYQVMILRLRQLCCHPYLILVGRLDNCIHPISDGLDKSQAEDFADPTVLVADECAKELARARKEIGPTIVAEVRSIFAITLGDR